jgi:hypothetical protein
MDVWPVALPSDQTYICYYANSQPSPCRVSIVETDEVRGRHTALQRIQTVVTEAELRMRKWLDSRQRYSIRMQVTSTARAIRRPSLAPTQIVS